MIKKTIASFIAILLLSTSFNLILIADPVLAADVCCQKTKSGDYCQFTSQDDCDPAFRQAPALCENTNFCQLGCCNDDTNGICYTNAPRSLCEARDGEFSLDPSCNLPQCEKGACQIGNECSFATLSRCRAEAAKYENVGFNFDASITNELDAINLCRQEEQGCCVSQDACSYTTREACSAVGSDGFATGKYCSDPTLACNCAPRSYKSCLPGQDDVYWFDSCGNQEAIAEECDYATGTICSQVESGDYKCISTSCIDTYKSPASPDSGKTRKSGESWCIYDASVGFGQDVVGSRHYRATCINGEEIIEPCKDYRQEICVSNDVEFEAESNLPLNPGSGTFTEAVCRTNRWQDCSSIEDEDDCNDQDVRDCFWFGNECLPHVPPGFRFWEGEGSDICSQANQECTVVYRKPGIGLFEGGRNWECIANCGCTESAWLIGSNNICKSLGDCGAKFNIVGDVSTDGLSSNLRNIRPNEVGDWSKVSSGSASASDPGSWQLFWDKAKTGVYIAGIQALYTRIAFGGLQFGAAKGVWSQGFFSGIEGFKALGNPDKMAQIGAQNFVKTTVFNPGQAIPKGTLFNSNLLTKEVGDEAVKNAIESGSLREAPGGYLEATRDGVFNSKVTAVQPSNFATVMQWVNTIMWIYTIYQIVDVLAGDTKEEHYTVTCEPWQAPTGGEKCDLCNDRGLFDGKNYKPCTEYACKSLGQSCSLLNEGSGNETCVFISQRDATSPLISPLEEVLPAGYSITKLSNGFKVNQKIKPFEDLSIGIKTNEPAQCKITNQLGIKFTDMQAFLGGSQYKYNHLLSIKIPQDVLEPEAVQITNGGQYSFYIRCQDGNGNDNDVDYLMQFDVQQGPDLTPPSVELTSIPNGGFAKHNIKQQNISFFMNEPASCRWSTTDSSYDVMPNKMSCNLNSLNPETNNLYECSTILSDVRDDAVNRYFIRCQDTSNNTMQQSYEYNLIGTIPLRIVEKQPSGKVALPILRVATADGATKDGRAICGYGKQNNLASMIQFFSTDAREHSQVLSLPDGQHTIYLACIDEAGNVATDSVSFTSFTDKQSPIITRIFEDRSLSQSLLHITTNEISVCEYSNLGQFAFGSGSRMPTDLTTDHEAPWGSLVYYIICADASNNTGTLAKIYP